MHEYLYWNQSSLDDYTLYYTDSLVDESNSSSHDYYGGFDSFIEADYAEVKSDERCIPSRKNEHCVCQELSDLGQGIWIGLYTLSFKSRQIKSIIPQTSQHCLA